MIAIKNWAITAVLIGLGPSSGLAQQNLPRPIVLYRPQLATQPPVNQKQPGQSQAGPWQQGLQPGQAQGGSATTSNTGPRTIVPSAPMSPGNPGPKGYGSAIPAAPGALPAAPGSTFTKPANPQGTLGPVGTGTPGLNSISNKPGGPQTQQPGAENPQNPSQTSAAAGDSQKPLTPEQEWEEEQKRPTYQTLLNPSAPWSLTHSGFSTAQQTAPNLYLGAQFNNWTNQQPASQMPGAGGEMSRFQPGAFGGYVGPNTFLGSGYSSWSNLSQGGSSPGSTGSWSHSVWP